LPTQIENLTASLPLENHKNAKKSCQIGLFSSKSATESLKPSTVLCFDLLICPLKVVV
jgi:hypothetical protein